MSSSSAGMDEDASPRVIKAELGEMNELVSMCPRCHSNGITRLMVCDIPHFREVIVSSFECSNCGERNKEVEFGGKFGEKHVVVELQIENEKDLNRQVVKSDFATIKFIELDLEIPPETQKGMLNTVEGLLLKTVEGLQAEQPVRRIMQPEVAAQIDAFCEKLENYRTLKSSPLTMTLSDPAGNSYVEPIYDDYYHPTTDSRLTRYDRPRTEIDRQILGLPVEHNQGRTDVEEERVERGQAGKEVVEMPTQCAACNAPGTVKMHLVDIPFFKETMIVAFKCEVCGFKSNEIKSGGEVPGKGIRLTLNVAGKEDLSRDVLKSHTAAMEIPEIGLELAPGTLGGFFSTVEGVLAHVHDKLSSTQMTAFTEGDSSRDHHGEKGAAESQSAAMSSFLDRLDELREGKEPFTMILSDPMGNIYIQNPNADRVAPDDVDPKLASESYTRSWQEDDDLGLHDMRVGDDGED